MAGQVTKTRLFSRAFRPDLKFLSLLPRLKNAHDDAGLRVLAEAFEEEGIAKGSAAVSYKGKMVDTPVYENALTILSTMKEIAAAEAK